MSTACNTDRLAVGTRRVEVGGITEVGGVGVTSSYAGDFAYLHKERRGEEAAPAGQSCATPRTSKIHASSYARSRHEL